MSCRKIAGKRLPPTEDNFKLHMLRVIYQLHIWRRAYVGVHELTKPVEFGYELTGDGLMAKMMTQPAAAPELLQDLVCACEHNSCNINCTCLQCNQPCTADCDCEAILPFSDLENICTNPLTSQ